MDYALTLDSVTKRFGQFTAVSNLSLRVPTGCIYGFLGQNGAGKTTTISMLTGLVPPSAGDATIDGRSLSTRSRTA